MQAFANTRLSNGAGRIGVIAPLVPATQMQSTVKSRQSKAENTAAAPSTSASGHKRKRAVSSDALFAADDEDFNDAADAEEEEEEKRPSKAQSSRKSQQLASKSAQRRNGHREEEAEEDDEDDDQPEEGGSGKSKKSRTAPEERGFKKQVAAGLTVTALPVANVARQQRDPRFDPLCGDFNPLHFQRHYEWISEEKEKEIKGWQAELRSGKSSAVKGQRLSEEEVEELRTRIQRAQQSLAAMRKEHAQNSILQKWKSSERKLQKSTGKGAFFLKDSEKKKLAQAAQFLHLQKNGQLQKFMEKRHKKVANVDHKYMPHEGRE